MIKISKGVIIMQIRPVSDLRNKFPEVEKCVENGEPVYLTKNGYGSMVVVSLEQFEHLTQHANFLSEFEMLVAEAKTLIRVHKDAEQVVVVRTAKNRIRSHVFHSMDEIIQDENPFVQELIEVDEAHIKNIVCMWNSYDIDAPAFNLMKCLLEASTKNESAQVILQGEYDYVFRTIKSLMPPKA